MDYFWSGLLQYVAGFGIGSYTFRVLYWVIGISLVGALYLRTRVKGVRDGRSWVFLVFWRKPPPACILFSGRPGHRDGAKCAPGTGQKNRLI